VLLRLHRSHCWVPLLQLPYQPCKSHSSASLRLLGPSLSSARRLLGQPCSEVCFGATQFPLRRTSSAGGHYMLGILAGSSVADDAQEQFEGEQSRKDQQRDDSCRRGAGTGLYVGDRTERTGGSGRDRDGEETDSHAPRA